MQFEYQCECDPRQSHAARSDGMQIYLGPRRGIFLVFELPLGI